MGLLDELEQEAQRLKAGADDVERAKQQREQVYRTRLEPGMVALYEYLSKLTKNLALLKPRKTFSFPIAGYGEVAISAGRPRAARAVGTACARTPFSIVVPVHRVVRADGSLGEYGGRPDVKQYLIDLERAAGE